MHPLAWRSPQRSLSFRFRRGQWRRRWSCQRSRTARTPGSRTPLTCSTRQRLRTLRLRERRRLSSPQAHGHPSLCLTTTSRAGGLVRLASTPRCATGRTFAPPAALAATALAGVPPRCPVLPGRSCHSTALLRLARALRAPPAGLQLCLPRPRAHCARLGIPAAIPQRSQSSAREALWRRLATALARPAHRATSPPPPGHLPVSRALQVSPAQGGHWLQLLALRGRSLWAPNPPAPVAQQGSPALLARLPPRLARMGPTRWRAVATAFRALRAWPALCQLQRQFRAPPGRFPPLARQPALLARTGRMPT